MHSFMRSEQVHKTTAPHHFHTISTHFNTNQHTSTAILQKTKISQFANR